MVFAWTLVFLVFHEGHSYILLTANIDDVHTIAKQMAASPVASQLNRILRRASNVFNHQLRTGNDGNNRRSLRSQLQNTSSFEPFQDNHIERQNHQDEPRHKHRHSGTDDDRHHHSSRRIEDSQNLTNSYNKDTRDHDSIKHERQESIDKSRPAERELKDNLKEKDEPHGEDKGKDNHENTNDRSGELEDRRKESRQWEERDDDIRVERQEKREGDDSKVTQGKRYDDGMKILAPESREDDEAVSHEEPDRNTRSHPDEIITLGKNASFYLNSIKKIMETV